MAVTSGTQRLAIVVSHPEVKAQPGGPITSLWRNKEHVDLFITGADGAVARLVGSRAQVL
jgi:hypothetical protein